MVRNDHPSITVEQAKQQLLAEDAPDSTVQLVTAFVRRHPVQSVLAAGAVGVALGLSPKARKAAIAALPMLVLDFLK